MLAAPRNMADVKNMNVMPFTVFVSLSSEVIDLRRVICSHTCFDPLMNCTKQEQRFIICSFLQEDVIISDIFGRVKDKFDDKYTNQNELYEWIESCKEGTARVVDCAFTDGLSAVICSQIKVQVVQRIRDNRRMNTDDTAS